MQEKNKSLFLVPLRRAIAALIDISIVGLISLHVLKLLGKDFEQYNWYLVVAVFMILWIGWDYLLTAIFKNTFGRWICGVNLANPDGNKIGLLATIKSGLVFWSLGIVFGIPWLQVVGLIGNYIYYLKTGLFLWDKLSGIEPRYKWSKGEKAKRNN